MMARIVKLFARQMKSECTILALTHNHNVQNAGLNASIKIIQQNGGQEKHQQTGNVVS